MKLITLGKPSLALPADAVLDVRDMTVSSADGQTVVGTIADDGTCVRADIEARLTFGSGTPYRYLVVVNGYFWRTTRVGLNAYLTLTGQLDEYRRKENA